jgi:hypothetical protein
MPKAPIRRKGVQKNLCLDADAAALFPLLSANSNAYGRLVSELLRQEMVRRETRQEMIRDMQALAQREGVGAEGRGRA